MQTALIVGVTGQDGSYLAELLLEKGYMVHGTKRRASSFNTHRVDHLFDHRHFKLHYADLTDGVGLIRLLQEISPDEIYNLGAQSHVQVSFELPEYTTDVNALGTLRLLEAVRLMAPQCRFYQASTSEMFGNAAEGPQNEHTPFQPCSPYAVSKLTAHQLVTTYRMAYKLHASCGILFNHSSSRRGETFVERKITMAVARIAAGKQKELVLGNLDARRDWGHAKDYVRAMWDMLQEDQPDDYVIATGKQWPVRYVVEEAFRCMHIELEWQGRGIHEVGVDKSGRLLVCVDPSYFRPVEVHSLCGNATKANRRLGWKPTVAVEDLIAEMMRADCFRIQQGKFL